MFGTRTKRGCVVVLMVMGLWSLSGCAGDLLKAAPPDISKAPAPNTYKTASACLGDQQRISDLAADDLAAAIQSIDWSYLVASAGPGTALVAPSDPLVLLCGSGVLKVVGGSLVGVVGGGTGLLTLLTSAGVDVSETGGASSALATATHGLLATSGHLFRIAGPDLLRCGGAALRLMHTMRDWQQLAEGRSLANSVLEKIAARRQARVDAEDCPAPCDCSDERHSELQSVVHNACHGAPRCSGQRTGAAGECNQIRDLKQRMSRCKSARNQINVECFRNGNTAHRGKELEALSGIQTCNRKMASMPNLNLPACPGFNPNTQFRSASHSLDSQESSARVLNACVPGGATDHCLYYGYYNDNQCDEDCPEPDPDCTRQNNGSGGACRPSSDGSCQSGCDGIDPDCSAASECGNITYQGSCDGQRVVYCLNGKIRELQCASRGQVCEFVDENTGYSCVTRDLNAGGNPAGVDPGNRTGGQNPNPDEQGCGSLTYLGECAGNTARYCNAGEVVTVDCTTHGQVCGFQSQETGYYCIATQNPGNGQGAERDLCEVNGWYNDGECDTSCARPDPDCQNNRNVNEPDRDLCEANGWYNDGECDANCPRPDPDCQNNRNVNEPARDVCEANGWYNDGECDPSCPRPDPDCQNNRNDNRGGGGGDVCDEMGRYDNGVCNVTCPRMDPDCIGDDGRDVCEWMGYYRDGSCDRGCPADPAC